MVRANAVRAMDMNINCSGQTSGSGGRLDVHLDTLLMWTKMYFGMKSFGAKKGRLLGVLVCKLR
jgi:hypothetical protein